MIHTWIKEQEEYSYNNFPGHGKAKLTDSERAIVKLKKDLREAKMETERFASILFRMEAKVLLV
jgi:transposase